jgi:hypothetical protein
MKLYSLAMPVTPTASPNIAPDVPLRRGRAPMNQSRLQEHS